MTAVSEPGVDRVALRSPWLRRFHGAAVSRPVLVCFPHAGAGANAYVGLSAALVDHVEVVAVQYPGRQDRLGEPLVGSIDDLAEQLAPQLQEHALVEGSGRSIAFLGHSMGAALAFELAHRLSAGPGAPALLFASGRRAPSVPITDPVYPRGEEALLAEVRRLDPRNAGMLDHPAVRAMVLPALASDYRANETYLRATGVKIECPVTALVGDDDPVTAVPDACAWHAHTASDFGLRVFPGGHFFLTERTDDVAAALRAAITRGGWQW
jgi:pyochelin biosynthetic protein PchC